MTIVAVVSGVTTCVGVAIVGIVSGVVPVEAAFGVNVGGIELSSMVALVHNCLVMPLL
jgi:predicted amino acid-binding ACT domain protein